MEYEDLPEADWGLKHTCQECSAKYYDMGRSPITCPLCGALLVEKTVLARSGPVPNNDTPPSPEVKEDPLEDESLESEEADEILPDDEVLPDLEDENDDVDPEEEITSVLDDTKTEQ